MTNIISENNNRCTVNEFILACSFILFIFVKNHLLVTSDVIICTGCTIFANTLYVYWGKKSTEQKLSFSNAAHLLDLIYVAIKNDQVISNSMGVMACTRFQHQGR